MEESGLDVPRPERFEEFENPTGSWTTDGDALTKVQGCMSPRVDPEDPAPKHEAGPPFAVGNLVAIVWSRSDPMLGGEQGCVVDAHHPWYSLHMRDGRLRRVNANRDVLRPVSLKTEEETRLCSRLEEEGRTGSFGVHIDTQLKSLHRIAEEKQYAKVVKANNAVISLYLWDDRVPLPEASKAESLQLLRQIGRRLFLRALRRDSVSFMNDTHGKDWPGLPKKNEKNQVTEVARDQQAICSMLWHATQTNWFEYKCGSRLVHLRFPLRYRN